jgi:ribosome-associated protein YbcJ (S4-like RNA binding protein)
MILSSMEITLHGQMIKVLNILESGGQIKLFLQEETVLVNGERDDRRVKTQKR